MGTGSCSHEVPSGTSRKEEGGGCCSSQTASRSESRRDSAADDEDAPNVQPSKLLMASKEEKQDTFTPTPEQELQRLVFSEPLQVEEENVMRPPPEISMTLRLENGDMKDITLERYLAGFCTSRSEPTRVKAVPRGKGAEHAGIKPGMKLTSIGGAAVSNLSRGTAERVVRTKLLQYNQEVEAFHSNETSAATTAQMP